MNQPNFTASSNECGRAIVAIVEKVTGQSLPMETCSRIVACVSIELKHSHAQLVEQNERMRQALASAWTAQSHLIAAKHLLEPIYGSTNYAPIGGPIAKAMDYIDKALEGVSFLAETEARAALNPPPTK